METDRVPIGGLQCISLDDLNASFMHCDIDNVYRDTKFVVNSLFIHLFSGGIICVL